MIASHKDLIVWQKASKLAVSMYLLTEKFPKSEVFGLTSQIRRAAVSIPSNIAEGHGRGGPKEFLNFLRISYGSTLELQTQIEIAKQLPFSLKLDYNDIEVKIDEVMRMLRSMITKRSV